MYRKKQKKAKKKLTFRSAFLGSNLDYFEAEADAAEADAEASAAGAEAAGAEAAGAEAAGAEASTAGAGAGVAAASGAGVGAGTEASAEAEADSGGFAPQPTRAIANRETINRDFFMGVFLK